MPGGQVLKAVWALQALAASPKRDQRWELRFLEDYPLAVCGDGSPAAYYYRPGDPGARKWLVFLQGGMWCWDVHSCSSRPLRELTSKLLPRGGKRLRGWALKMRGIFDLERSSLAGFNTAYVVSCSSDAFLGDTSPSLYTTGLRTHYRGKRIVDAVFADLTRRTGLGERADDLVVFGGCSSGARGALIHLDRVAASLAGRARVVGLLDSPLWVPLKPYGPSVTPFEEQVKEAAVFYTAPELFSEECLHLHPGDQRWKCIFPAYRLPLVRTPYVLSHSQYDKFAINWNVHSSWWLPKSKVNKSLQAWAEGYRHKVIDYIQPILSANSSSAVFSSACYFHCTTMFNLVFWVRVGGFTLLELLDRWLSAPQPRAELLRDDCQGFDCGAPGGFAALVPAVLNI
mmetsp:Transcript_22388/g.46388  ORF Transcript_22388/g.46388 Transcript_22388/m.46388 type:complete len:399 (+) Transcript_22388:40-1236(+)